jgi:hypothetical protein
MRTSNGVAATALIGFALLAPAAAFDGTRTPPNAPLSHPDRPVPPRAIPEAGSAAVTPYEAFRSGTRALRAGEMDKAVTSLEYAAAMGETQQRARRGILAGAGGRRCRRTSSGLRRSSRCGPLDSKAPQGRPHRVRETSLADRQKH